MSVIARLKEFMEVNGLSNSQFADTAGIPRPTMSQLLNGRKNKEDNGKKSNDDTKKISSDILNKIHKGFPQLNIMWLLFGDGDMESESNIEFSEPQNVGIFDPDTKQMTERQELQSRIDFDDQFTENDTNRNLGTKSPVSAQKSVNNPVSAATASIPQPTSIDIKPDQSKKVQSIMVFYSDNSFEIFKPSER